MLDFGVAGGPRGRLARVLTAATSWAAAALRGWAPPQESLLGMWHWENPSREQIPEGYLLAYKQGPSFGNNFCAF